MRASLGDMLKSLWKLGPDEEAALPALFEKYLSDKDHNPALQALTQQFIKHYFPTFHCVDQSAPEHPTHTSQRQRRSSCLFTVRETASMPETTGADATVDEDDTQSAAALDETPEPTALHDQTAARYRSKTLALFVLCALLDKVSRSAEIKVFGTDPFELPDCGSFQALAQGAVIHALHIADPEHNIYLSVSLSGHPQPLHVAHLSLAKMRSTGERIKKIHHYPNICSSLYLDEVLAFGSDHSNPLFLIHEAELPFTHLYIHNYYYPVKTPDNPTAIPFPGLKSGEKQPARQLLREIHLFPHKHEKTQLHLLDSIASHCQEVRKSLPAGACAITSIRRQLLAELKEAVEAKKDMVSQAPPPQNHLAAARSHTFSKGHPLPPINGGKGHSVTPGL